jgi:hypothetical protein
MCWRDSTPMPLVPQLLEDRIETTPFGKWRRCRLANGRYFKEFVSHRRLWGVPLVHIVSGRDPRTGRRAVAKGIIAIGQFAVGVISIGQVAAGLISVGQLAFGLLFVVAQVGAGIIAIGQFAASVVFALGQFAIGWTAIGQFACGQHAIGQVVIPPQAALQFWQDWSAFFAVLAGLIFVSLMIRTAAKPSASRERSDFSAEQLSAVELEPLRGWQRFFGVARGLLVLAFVAGLIGWSVFDVLAALKAQQAVPAIAPLRAILIVGVLTAAWFVLDALIRWPARCPKCDAHVGFEAGPRRLVACPHCGISFQENPSEARADRDADFPGEEGANA